MKFATKWYITHILQVKPIVRNCMESKQAARRETGTVLF